jgi:hypothetical protein
MARPIKWTEKKSMDLAEELIQWLQISENIWINTFLIQKKGLYPQLISELGEKYPQFSEAIKSAKALQEGKVVKNALQNEYNSTMSIFLLKNNFGWKDKTEQEIEHKGVESIKIDIVRPE